MEIRYAQDFRAQYSALQAGDVTGFLDQNKDVTPAQREKWINFPGGLDNGTALFLVVESGSLVGVMSMLEAGAKPNARNKYLETPLFIACAQVIISNHKFTYFNQICFVHSLPISSAALPKLHMS